MEKKDTILRGLNKDWAYAHFKKDIVKYSDMINYKKDKINLRFNDANSLKYNMDLLKDITNRDIIFELYLPFGRIKELSILEEDEAKRINKVILEGHNKIINYRDGDSVIKVLNNNTDVNIVLDNCTQISIDDLLVLKSNPYHSKIKFEIYESEKNQRVAGRNYNLYNVEELLIIKEKINAILNFIPSNYSKLGKLIYAYMYIGMNYSYDYEMVKESQAKKGGFTDKEKKSVYELLTTNMGICNSFTELFRVILKSLGFKSKALYIWGHVWNIVKIGNHWYHCDITLDLDEIKQKKEPSHLLKITTELDLDDNYYIDKINNSFVMADKSICIKDYTKNIIKNIS
jgi:hypothetical protein